MKKEVHCSVSGCDRSAMYKGVALCQKHYFRIMRNGTTKLRAEIKVGREFVSPEGYVKVYLPNHPIGNGSYAYKHRAVIFAEFGHDLPPCELCGKSITWKTCHIDHIDNDRKNNERSNLRQTCSTCNTGRGRRPAIENKNAMVITIGGVSLTANEWARRSDVKVCGNTILWRKRRGASDHDAVYGEKKTHNGKVYVDKRTAEDRRRRRAELAARRESLTD